jgi:hypothetical protein
MGFETPKLVVYPRLPPPAMEDSWAWYHNAGSEDEDEDDNDEVEEKSE